MIRRPTVRDVSSADLLDQIEAIMFSDSEDRLLQLMSALFS